MKINIFKEKKFISLIIGKDEDSYVLKINEQKLSKKLDKEIINPKEVSKNKSYIVSSKKDTARTYAAKCKIFNVKNGPLALTVSSQIL